MRKSHAFWGVILIFVGLVWILGTTNTVSIDLWGSVKTLYPLLVIAGGITLFLKKDIHWARVIIWVLVCAVITGYGICLGSNNAGTASGSNTFKMTSGTGSAKLDVTAMETNLSIGSTDSDLARIDTDIKNLNYSFSEGKNSYIRYFQKTQFFGPQWGGIFTANLNSTIPWDINVTGTLSLNGKIDFSNFALENCTLQTASCDLDVIAGNRQDTARIQLSSVSGNINITVPAGSGIRVETGAVSSNVRGNGVTLVRNGNTYESSNYDSAGKVVILKISSVSTEINVNVK